MKYEIFEIGELKLCVSKEHRFGTDAVNLADFAAPKPAQVIADLCTGCGIVPFLLVSGEHSSPLHKIYALDINEDAVNLLRGSVRINSLENIIFPVHEDLKNITQIPAGSVDLVTMNPPYYKADDGFRREGQGSARHELLCTLGDCIAAAGRLLKHGGRLKMCHIPERLTDVICTLRKYNLEPKVLRIISNNKNEPRLLLIDAKKGGKAGAVIQLTIDN
ncbi:MAG: methyltransferase [Oscillospiraceae bacterium]|jgi:tRNA1(Val) A37 N6-methylase TrmN6|nr:methyltransferase [Oscillospiraceae bacterium]